MFLLKSWPQKGLFFFPNHTPGGFGTLPQKIAQKFIKKIGQKHMNLEKIIFWPAGKKKLIWQLLGNLKSSQILEYIPKKD